MSRLLSCPTLAPCVKRQAEPNARCGSCSAIAAWKSFKFRRQHSIDRYIADFACISRKLVVEVDGLSHTMREQIAHDQIRSARLTQLGWRLLRVSDGAVLSEESGTIAKILAALQQTPSP